MNTAIFVIQIFLIVGFAVGGLAQLTVPYSNYAKFPFQAWANDFQPWHIKLIGLLKVVAATGIVAALFLPALRLIAPLAAIGLALVMAGAMATHLRREEYPHMLGNLVYLGMALFLAYGKLAELAV